MGLALLQLFPSQIGSDFSTGQNFLSKLPSSFFIGLDLLFIIILVWLLVMLLRVLLHRMHAIPTAFQKSILMVTVPKEASELERKEIGRASCRERVYVLV